MSTPENTIADEKLYEAFEIAMCDDRELQALIAYEVLSPMDFYLFCKEDAWDKVDWDQVWIKVVEQFYDLDGRCYDIRYLCSRAYSINF